ncbi:MAG: ATP-binding cassette domain-containing protein [Candidatus Onthovivens sp.]|nr:ATP-binding cassette domain-containing protein [Candidatus Onthovivens sp.]
MFNNNSEKRAEKLKAKALENQRNHIYKEMVAKEKQNKKGRKIAPKDSYISLQHINKIYDNKVQAVFDFNLEIKQHEFIVFVGPSGCGKSTTLRMIAGLENITAGDLYIDGVYANDLEPKNRDIAMVFQSYALYPHMTVFGNMAFGLKIRKVPTQIFDKDGKPLKAINKGLIRDLNREVKQLSAFLEECKEKGIEEVKIKSIEADINEAQKKIDYLSITPVDVYKNRHLPKEEIKSRVLEASDILQIRDYLDRKPKALSGGQCQRVALGRAIVRNAKVFLMDEPLSNLDAKLRVQMRSEIIQLHNKLKATTIYVTHDQTEAMTMATRIVVMKKGYIQQIGTPSEIYNHPANVFVATFIGSPAMNLLEGTMKNDIFTFKNGIQIQLPDSFVEANKKFFKDEKINCLKEKEEILANFYERNKILESISNLEKQEKTDDIKKQIEKLQNDLEIVLKSNERLTYLEEAIKQYDEYEKEKEYPLLFGIRPEDIYESSHVEKSSCLSQEFNQEVVVAELLGHEYFVHSYFGEEKIVAKLSAKHIINVGETIKFIFDLERSHIFDQVSTKLIK